MPDRDRTSTLSRHEAAAQLADEIQTHSDPPPSVLRTAPEWAARFRDFGFFRCTHTPAVIGGEGRMLRFVSFADSRPREATTIFRVCDPARAVQVSWTPLLVKALEYAPGGRHATLVVHSEPHLFSATIAPDDVLAVLNDYEWIIDTARLEPVDHGPVNLNIPTKRLGDLPVDGLRKFIPILGEDYPVQIVNLTDPYVIAEGHGAS